LIQGIKVKCYSCGIDKHDCDVVDRYGIVCDCECNQSCQCFELFPNRCTHLFGCKYYERLILTYQMENRE
jgi:hypothetical protein